jgi:hypothetical protein
LKLLAALIRRQVRHKSAFAASFLLFAVAGSMQLHARVTRVVVESREPQHDLPEGKIAYERIQGVIYGEVDPRVRYNSIIQDIALAPRNARGMVEYAATFTLLKPVKLSEASGILLYEVVNRGASIVPKDLTTGDIFLSSGWQGDLAFRGKSVSGLPGETIQLPIAKNVDGSPITGPALLRFSNIKDGTASISTHLAASYVSSGAPPLPVDLDTTHATLTSRTFETVTGVAGGERTIASSDWSWGNCSKTPFPGIPDPQSICLRQGFDASLLYQLSYRAKDPIILGLGLAAIRDVASFFRNGIKNDTAVENSVAGAISHTIVRGASQSGNLIRTFLNLGFNEDESGRRVFDGAMPTIAARQTPINLRFAVPGGASSIFEPGSDGTVWWAHWPDTVRRQKPSGLLDRCTASHTCPLIIEVLGSTEFWSLRASPDFVGTDNAKDIPLPENVRRYYIASTQHGGGPGGFHDKAPAPEPQRGAFAAICALPLNPNPMREISRALLAALRAWVVKGTLPPPSLYPTLAAGTLTPASSEVMGFPAVPGLPRPDAIANPLLVYDFGNTFEYPDVSGAIKQQPPAVANVIAPMVPRVDADGNEVGGIHTVLQEAALGTYLGWNLVAQGFFKGQYCSLYGSYLPFSRTKEDREAAYDPRLSLRERYGTHGGYVCTVRRAAANLVRQRFLLQDDADRMIAEAQASDILLPENKHTPEDEAVAARRCATAPNKSRSHR